MFALLKGRRLLVLGLALILLCTIMISFYIRSSIKTEKMTTFTLQELQPQTDFYLVGSVEPAKIVELKLDKNRGQITDKKVGLNDQVKEGQELFSYSNPEGELAIKEAELVVTNRTKIVEQAQLKTNILWEQYNKLSNQFNELSNKIPLANEEEKEGLNTRKDEIEAQLNQIMLDAKSSENTIIDAELELEKAQLEFKNVNEMYNFETVLSEISGEVKEIDESQINMNPTEKNPEKPFMTIVDTSSLFIKGTVDEFRRNKLEIGQLVSVTDRDDGNKKWTGKIIKIGDLKQATVIDEEQGGNPNLSQFYYEVALEKSDEPPIIGSHCFVELIEDEKIEVKIPNGFVINEKQNHYVFIEKEGKVKKQKIEVTKLPDDEDFYILKSSLPNSTKLIYPKTGIQEGMEVTRNDSFD